jgi:phosphoglycerate dehydrogenase-like enzyme
MDAKGGLTLNGEPLTGDPAPTLAWATHDLFVTPVARDFMVTLLKSPGLKWLQSASAGVDNPVFGQLVSRGVRLTTSHGQAVGMADYVVAGVLDHFQRGPERREAQAAHEWRRIATRELLDTRWLIIGFGAVGQAVATRAKAFGAQVIGVRRNQDADPLADRIVSPDSLADELADADVVVLACPLTPATRHMADSGFFADMKDDAVLVNVGRGGLVDETALLAGLDAGRPARAVLDVFETEPLPPNSPFWSHPRVSLTAHCSGVGVGQNDRNRDLFLDNLDRYLSGKPLRNEVAKSDLNPAD